MRGCYDCRGKNTTIARLMAEIEKLREKHATVLRRADAAESRCAEREKDCDSFGEHKDAVEKKRRLAEKYTQGIRAERDKARATLRSIAEKLEM